MLRRMTSLIAAFLLCATLVAGSQAVLPGCKAADAAIEVKLCTDTIKAMCDKINQCFPSAAIFSAALQMCTGEMGVFCASDELYGCDIDNGKLSKCKSGIEAMGCNLAAISTFPAECTLMVNCYTS